MTPTPAEDTALAVAVADEAGVMLRALRDSYGMLTGDPWTAPRALRDDGDAQAHTLIVDRLHVERPHDLVLSEEGADDSARLSASRLWIVDPLDGTWEFGLGRPDWAVHVALWQEGVVTAAAVALPDSGRTWSTGDDVTDRALPVDRPVRLVVSRSRGPRSSRAVVAGLREEFGVEVEVVPVGSVGAKVGELLAGRADGYVHDSGFHEWDVAAPYAVARHHGLVATRLDGVDVTFNRMPPYVPDLLVAVPALAEPLRRLTLLGSGTSG